MLACVADSLQPPMCIPGVADCLRRRLVNASAEAISGLLLVASPLIASSLRDCEKNDRLLAVYLIKVMIPPA